MSNTNGLEKGPHKVEPLIKQLTDANKLVNLAETLLVSECEDQTEEDYIIKQFKDKLRKYRRQYVRQIG